MQYGFIRLNNMNVLNNISFQNLNKNKNKNLVISSGDLERKGPRWVRGIML